MNKESLLDAARDFEDLAAEAQSFASKYEHSNDPVALRIAIKLQELGEKCLAECLELSNLADEQG